MSAQKTMLQQVAPTAASVVRRALFAALLAAVWLGAFAPARAAEKTFATADDAAAALVQAVKADNRAAILAVLGNASTWISSGDATADRAAAARFVAAYETTHALAGSGDKLTLTIGADDHPFAFPLVKDGDRWRFDTAAGKDELLRRRVGGNELETINVLQAIVDAQREYAALNPTGAKVPQYATRITSSPGKRDGLYWPVKAGEAPSPLGGLIASAAAEGYAKGKGGPRPFHGYYYRLLKGQTANAKSGAVDYVVHGRAIGGYAVIAYPAKYGNSGVMSFIVNHDGTIYQADLGPSTAGKAAAMQRFDPGPGWTPVAAK